MARLHLSHSRPEMSRLSLWLDDQERELAMPHRVAYAVRMCVEETVVNLIDHTAPPKERPDITVDLAWRGDVMVAVIEDRGPPFDLRDAAPPARPISLDDAVPGGLGLLLIRSFASKIDYESEPGRNRLTLRFARPVEAKPVSDRT
jgi:sigma-B regulation protein RsbU (phosphoserine phosphatase)